MQNRNDNVSYFASLTGHGIYQADPLTRRELGRFARQQAMGSFIIKAFKFLGGLIRNWFIRSRQYQELNALPDYLLKDMGFRRDQISKVLYNDLKRSDPSPSPSPVEPAPAAVSQSGADAEKETPRAA